MPPAGARRPGRVAAMIQVFCPACENVVWVENPGEDRPGSCPECNNALHLLTRRKSRPAVEAPDTRVAPGPAAKTRQKPVPVTEEPEPAPTRQPAPTVTVEEVPEDERFCLPWGDPQMRYVPLPYRPDGGVSPLRFPFYLAALLTAGAA